MLKIKKSKQIFSMFLAVLLLACTMLPVNMAAASWTKVIIPDGATFGSSGNLNTWLFTSYDPATTEFDLADFVEFDPVRRLLLIKRAPGDATVSWEVNNIGSIRFKNVREIGNRSVDVIISSDKAFFPPSLQPAVNELSTKVQIASFKNDNGGSLLWLGGNSPIGTTDQTYEIWHSRFYMDITTNVVYSDSGETVDVGFIHCANDLDYNRSDTLDAIETIDGYVNGEYFLSSISDANLNITEISNKRLKIEPIAGANGFNPWDSCVYLPTETGKFRTRVYSGYCGSEYLLCSQYLNRIGETNPAKTIVDPQTEYRSGDTVTFDVSMRMGKMWEDTLVTYSSLSFYDQIPAGLTLVPDSGELYKDGVKLNDADIGTFSYTGNKITFTFDPAYLAEERNYDGKTLTMRFDTTVDSADAAKTINNTGYTNIDGFEMETNEVEVKVLPDPDYSNLDPHKTIVDPKNSYKPGDEVTFDIAMTMGNWNVDTFTTYTSMSIFDQIPAGLTLVPASGELYKDGVKLNDADIGTFSYTGNKITFAFDPAYLAEESNYDGKTLTMRFNATVDNADVAKTIKNTGYVDVDGNEIETNEVEVKVVPDQPVVTTTPPPVTPEPGTTPPVVVTTQSTPAPGYGVIVSTGKPGTPPTETIDLGAGISDDSGFTDRQEETTVYIMLLAAFIAAGTAGAVSLRRKTKR